MKSFDLFCVGSIPTFLSFEAMRGLLYLYVHFIIVILWLFGHTALDGGESGIANWYAGVSET